MNYWIISRNILFFISSAPEYQTNHYTANIWLIIIIRSAFIPQLTPSAPRAAVWKVQALEYERRNPDYAQLIMQQNKPEDSNKLFKELKREEIIFINEARNDN